MSDQPPHPLTDVGKLLFVFTLLSAGLRTYLAFADVFSDFPSGSYSVFYLLGPIAIGSALFFFGVTSVLRWRGIAVFTSDIEVLTAMREEKYRRLRKN